MSLYSISVNFLCNSSGCGASFKYVDQFIEHKKEKHFHEFQTIKSITFEEASTPVPMNQHKRGNLVESTPPEPLEFEDSYTRKKRKLGHDPPTPTPAPSNIHPVAQLRKTPGSIGESFAYNDANKDMDVDFALALDDEDSYNNENKNEEEFFDNDIEISNLMSSSLSEQGQGWLLSSSTTTNPPVIPQLESKNFTCNVCGHSFRTPPELTSLLTAQPNPNAAEGGDDLFTMKCPRRNCGKKAKSKGLNNNTTTEEESKESKKPSTSTVSVSVAVAATTKAKNSTPGPGPLPVSVSVSKQAPKGVAAKAGTGNGGGARSGPLAEQARPFLCQEDNCGAKFVKLSSLNFHTKTRHPTDGTDMRKFICEVCERGFYTRNELKRHAVTHSEEQPFKCDYPGCSFASKYKSKFSKHLRNAHGE